MSQSDDYKAKSTAAKLTVLDRMVEAGWIQAMARRGDLSSLSFTRDGLRIVMEFRRILFLGGEMTAHEKLALLQLIGDFEQA